MLQVVKSFRTRRLFWFYVAFSLLTLWLIFGYAPVVKVDGTRSDLHLRVWGMFLQLVGTGTVFWDLTSTARELGEKELRRKAWEYVRSVFIAPQSVPRTVVITPEGGGIRFSGHAPVVTQSVHSLEDRIAGLEKEIPNLVSQIGAVKAELQAVNDKVTMRIAQHASQMQQAVSNVHDRLRVSLVGNFAILTFGACWVVVGIVLTSIPDLVVR